MPSTVSILDDERPEARAFSPCRKSSFDVEVRGEERGATFLPLKDISFALLRRLALRLFEEDGGRGGTVKGEERRVPTMVDVVRTASQ